MSNIERRTAVCLGCGRREEYDFKPGGDPVRVPMDFGYCADCGPLAEQLRRAVAALREVRRAALSTAGGDRERCRQGLAEVVEITGRALGGR
jgi:hypothetical protein